MKNFFSLSSLFAASLLTSQITFAEQAPSWDFIQASYITVEADITNEFSIKPDGYGLSGAKMINDDFFVVGSYQALSDDLSISNTKLNLDVTSYNLGLGYRYAISNTTDVFGIVSYEDAEIKASASGDSDKVSDNGYGLSAGIRSMITDSFELAGSINYVDIDDSSNTVYLANAFYHFNSNFSVGAGYTYSDDADSVSLSARYSF